MFSFFKRKPKNPPPEAIESVAPESTQEPTVDSHGAQELRAPEQAAVATDISRPQAEEQHPSHASLSAIAGEAEVEIANAGGAPGLVDDADQAQSQDTQTEDEIVAAQTSEQEKKSWFSRLKTGLSKTSTSLATLFVGTKIDEDLYEELETALLMADAGVDATQSLLDSLRKRVKDQKLTDGAQVKTALRDLLAELLKPLEQPLVLGRVKPMVMMIAGVNGAGKTTTIGKLAKHMQAHGQSVLLAAGDTFRAAAREQLTVWGERNNISVISQQSGDPAAVAFDSVHSAQARNIDVVMIDTAGRLPTQLHLMDELKKIRRVIGKGMDTAPHEVLLVIDGNTGQNAVAQVKSFDDALGLTGLIVTKLDGTAKGGVLAAIVKARPIPVYFIGVGEQIEDLQPFNAEQFADALLG